MKLNGEVLNGRLVLYADELAVELNGLVEALRNVGDDLTLVGFGKGATQILSDLAAQFAQAAVQVADGEEPGE